MRQFKGKNEYAGLLFTFYNENEYFNINCGNIENLMNFFGVTGYPRDKPKANELYNDFVCNCEIFVDKVNSINNQIGSFTYVKIERI